MPAEHPLLKILEGVIVMSVRLRLDVVLKQQQRQPEGDEELTKASAGNGPEEEGVGARAGEHECWASRGLRQQPPPLAAVQMKVMALKQVVEEVEKNIGFSMKELGIRGDAFII